MQKAAPSLSVVSRGLVLSKVATALTSAASARA